MRSAIVIILFDVVGILVLGSSVYFIRKGRALRRNYRVIRPAGTTGEKGVLSYLFWNSRQSQFSA